MDNSSMDAAALVLPEQGGDEQQQAARRISAKEEELGNPAAADDKNNKQFRPTPMQQHPDHPRPSKTKNSQRLPVKRPPPAFVDVTIVSARYEPCEGLCASQSVHSAAAAAAATTITRKDGVIDKNNVELVLYTRDVTPLVRALLVVQRMRDEPQHDPDSSNAAFETNHLVSSTFQHSDSNSIRFPAVIQGQQRAQIRLLEENDSLDMNVLFGDPIPGTSKRLCIHYIISEVYCSNEDPENDDVTSSPHSSIHSSPGQRRRQRLGQGVSQTMTFAEHEKVYLRRNLRRPRPWLYHEGKEDSVHESVTNHHYNKHDHSSKQSTTPLGASLVASANSTTSTTTWHLDRATAEIVVPLVVPFLGILDRVACRCVSVVFAQIIASVGVAVTINHQDPHLAPILLHTPQFLRNMLRHSHQSLRSLLLSGATHVQQCDLHPAIPHLQQLRSLDISRCIHLDDSTLQLLAQHVAPTLQVLYLKGLRNVTDVGVTAMARSCRHLQVLDVSLVSQLTDVAGRAIGQHLTNLRALYLRDNYRFTRASIVDAMAQHCTHLEQWTVWGCTRLTKFEFSHSNHIPNLVLLNLWGCFGLGDETAQALQNMHRLQSLIVSECHRLTDAFVVAVARQLGPQLHHLHLRYCRKITDVGIRAIAAHMPALYSLDVSFCTHISVPALYHLLELRGRTLSELRLQGCHQLEIATPTGQRRQQQPQSTTTSRHRRPEPGRGGYAGRQLLAVLRSHGSHCAMNILDVRQCCAGLSRYYMDDDDDDDDCDDVWSFVEGMTALHFAQPTEPSAPGFFARPARCSVEMVDRWVRQFTMD